jgi:hypothetical protein
MDIMDSSTFISGNFVIKRLLITSSAIVIRNDGTGLL